MAEADDFVKVFKACSDETWHHGDVVNLLMQTSEGHNIDIDGPTMSIQFMDKSTAVVEETEEGCVVYGDTCSVCGDEMDTDCNGNDRCPTCDDPCPCCSDGGGPMADDKDADTSY